MALPNSSHLLTAQTAGSGSDDLRLHQLTFYLEKLREDEATSGVAQVAILLWQRIEHTVKIYPVASVGTEGQILFAWDRDEHHFEIEVFPDEHIEAFYYNLQTGEAWDEDIALERLEETVMEYLKRL